MTGLDDFLLKTCRLYTQHLYNTLTFQKDRVIHDNDGSLLGYHSRALTLLLHPEKALIFRGFSKKYYATKESRHLEHIVPLSFICNKVCELFDGKLELVGDELDKLLDDGARLMYQCLGIAFITKEESKLLDKASGLKADMPSCWDDNKDPICRLHAVGIELVDENGNEIRTLKVELPL
ncbi:hypothetical protein AB8Q18_08530 [Neisseriaceae bacterium CLB008]